MSLLENFPNHETIEHFEAAIAQINESVEIGANPNLKISLNTIKDVSDKMLSLMKGIIEEKEKMKAIATKDDELLKRTFQQLEDAMIKLEQAEITEENLLSMLDRFKDVNAKLVREIKILKDQIQEGLKERESDKKTYEAKFEKIQEDKKTYEAKFEKIQEEKFASDKRIAKFERQKEDSEKEKLRLNKILDDRSKESLKLQKIVENQSKLIVELQIALDELKTNAATYQEEEGNKDLLVLGEAALQFKKYVTKYIFPCENPITYDLKLKILDQQINDYLLKNFDESERANQKKIIEEKLKRIRLREFINSHENPDKHLKGLKRLRIDLAHEPLKNFRNYSIEAVREIADKNNMKSQIGPILDILDELSSDGLILSDVFKRDFNKPKSDM